MIINPLTCIDFYKADHRSQYPTNTTEVYSNFTPRNVIRDKLLPHGYLYDDTVVFFGLQYFIDDFLVRIWGDSFFKLEKKIMSLF